MSKRAAKSPRQTAAPEAAQQPPTERRALAIKASREREDERPLRTRLAVKEGPKIESPHADAEGWSSQINDAFGTTSADFTNIALTRLFNVTGAGAGLGSEMQINAALALMGAIEPQNELEAALGEQIIAAHVTSMDFLKRARMNAGEFVTSAVAYTNAATKLSRTMGTLVETLAKLRSGGKQQVEVRYVYVDARGGQNIIASPLSPGGGAAGSIPHQPHVHGIPLAPGVSMWGENPSGDLVPTAGDEGQAPLPAARRQEPGSAEGDG